MNSGKIYCITSPSGKQYVGQTKRNLDVRLAEHAVQTTSTLINHAIRKYGLDNMKVEVLKECCTDDLNQWEIHYIQELNTITPNGYNIRSGGGVGSTHCESSRKRMSDSKKGVLNYNFGKPRTDETKQRISAAKSGEKHHFYGTKLTEEHVLKLAIAHRKRECDKNLPMYVVYVAERPEHYCSEGYAVVNHPILKSKYFTSKKLSLDEKLLKATEYINSEMSAVHRLNGSG